MDIKRREQVIAIQKRIDKLRSALASAISEIDDIKAELSDISADEWHAAGRAACIPDKEYQKEVEKVADRLDLALSMFNRASSELEGVVSLANMAYIALGDAKSKIIFKIV